MSLTIRPMIEDDRDRVLDMTAQSFNYRPIHREIYREAPAHDVRVAEEGGRIVASLRILPIAQFFGGRSVPSAGISAVAVAPEARGRRVAETLMAEVLRDVRRDRPLSSLYPATVPLYRRSGYEYAAPWYEYRAPLDKLPRDGSLEPEPMDDTALEEVEACYRAWAGSANGPIDRPRELWSQRIFRVFEDDVYRYLVREDGRVTGYVVYTQPRPKDKDWGYDIDCRDLVWTTPEAARGMLAFLGRHRSLAREVGWHGRPFDPLGLFLDEQEARTQRVFLAMARLADVPAAFEARGYPGHVRAAVELDVRDAHIPENAGAWRIEVAEGTAKVAPVASASGSVDVGTLAAIWSGFLTAGDALRAGRLGADTDAVAALEAMFAGSPPWMSDFF